MSSFRYRSLDYRGDFLAAEERKKPFKKIRFPMEIAGVIILAFLLVYFFGLQVRVSDDSMGETLHAGQKVLVNRASYRVADPKADDIVLYHADGTGWQHETIKRVIAVPGDHVQITDGYLYVNDSRYEPYGDIRIDMAGIAKEELVLGEDEYFLMGDDPYTSEDSRYEAIGLISRDEILGRVWIRISPIGDFGRIE